MKFFRVGSCLALLMAGVACTQASQNVTAPTAAVGGSTAETAGADGSTLKVTAPALISPVDGARAEDRRPTLIWLNSTGKYGGIGVAYDIELSTPTAVVYSRTVGESPDIGAHLVEFDLDYDTDVFVARPRTPRQPRQLRTVVAWATFLSPTRPVAAAPSIGDRAPAGAPRRSRRWAPAKPASRVRTTPPSCARWPAPSPAALRTPASRKAARGSSWIAPSTRCAPRTAATATTASAATCIDPSLDVVSYYYRPDPKHPGQRRGLHLRHDRRPLRCTPSMIWNDVTDITFQSGTLGRTIVSASGPRGRALHADAVSLHDPGPA